MKFNSLIPEVSVIKLEYERVEEKFAFLSLGDIQIMI